MNEKEYIEREAAISCCVFGRTSLGLVTELRKIPAADVVEVKLLDDGTLIVTTDKYPNVTRVFVEDGKTSGSLFYAEEV